MDVARRVSELIAIAVEWPHTRACVIAAAVSISAIGGYVWSTRKPVVELVSIEEALAQGSPARVVMQPSVWSPEDQARAVEVPPVGAVDAASHQAKSPRSFAPILQSEASAESASAVAAPVAWGAMLGAMTRDQKPRRATAATAETAPRAMPVSATPLPAAAAIPPSGEPVRSAPAHRRARRARIVHYIYVEPRRSSYRRRGGDPVGDVSRTVSRGVRTISRVLSSIAN